MSRIAYVNGRYRPLAAASLHIEDRGTQFGDAVYEVWSLRDGVLFDVAGHLTRLRRSLGELGIGFAMTDASLMAVVRETVRQNRVRNGIVYLQIGRGAAPRNHVFPDASTTPASIVITVRPADWVAADRAAQKGVGVITTPDIRWGRCDIKTVGLLPNALAKQAAREAGAVEAWMVDPQGMVTEGSSTNAWIVKGNAIVTRPVTDNILAGITRARVVELGRARQLTIEERPFSLDEARAADEAFMTSATTFVTPIVSIDGAAVGTGVPGPIATHLRQDYLAR